MSSVAKHSVTRRRVFYIPGYDPYPPRRYRELYRKEAARQAEISGYEISVEGRNGPGQYGWRVSAVIDGQAVQSDVEVLVWSDLVRASMNTGILATYLQLFRTAWIYVSSGALRRMMQLRKGPVIAALYPIVMLLAQALVAAVVAWVLGSLVSRFTMAGAGWIVGLPVFVLILRWFRRKDGRFFAYYLMHDYAFTARDRGANPAVLDARIGEFIEEVRAALASDVEEVLVVGHSSGAHLAVHILAALVREGAVMPEGPALGFLSLGQVVPMVSFLPEAGRLRADLHDLSRSDLLTWVDVSAPGDGCSFALCDPVAVSGVAPEDKKWPLVFSAAFTQSLSPERWKELKRRYFRLHFQYLCAFDRPKDYDYFQITAGPVTLAERYKGRPPSKSRIDVTASPHTSMMP